MIFFSLSRLGLCYSPMTSTLLIRIVFYHLLKNFELNIEMLLLGEYKDPDQALTISLVV